MSCSVIKVITHLVDPKVPSRMTRFFVSHHYKQYVEIFLLVNIDIPAFLTPRTEFLGELVARFQCYHII